jgi:hypothetical protein
MITLHVYMNPKPGKSDELEAGIRDSWLTAMAEQPGFVSASVLEPFDDDALSALRASKPRHQFEIVAFWRSEKERLEWVARPIHDQVFLPLLELADDVSFTLKTVTSAWDV